MLESDIIWLLSQWAEISYLLISKSGFQEFKGAPICFEQTHKHTHMRTHMCIHTHICTHTCTHTHTHTHTNMHTYTHTHTQILTHARTHARMHTHAHTHTHTHTFTKLKPYLLLSTYCDCRSPGLKFTGSCEWEWLWTTVRAFVVQNVLLKVFISGHLTSLWLSVSPGGLTWWLCGKKTPK